MNISKAFIVEILLLIELFQSVQNESPMVFVCKSFHGVSSKNDKAASALCMKRKGGGLVSLARRDIVRARYAAEVSDHLQAIFSNGGRGIWSCGGGIEEDVIQGITVYNVIVSPDRTSVHVQVSVLGDVMDRRQAMGWLVKNVKSIRYNMAERLKGRRRVPTFSFQEVDFSSYFQIQSEMDKLAKSVNMSAEESWPPDESIIRRTLPADKSLLTPEELQYYNARALAGDLINDLPALLGTGEFSLTNRTFHEEPLQTKTPTTRYNRQSGPEKRMFNRLSDFDRFGYEDEWKIEDLQSFIGDGPD